MSSYQLQVLTREGAGSRWGWGKWNALPAALCSALPLEGSIKQTTNSQGHGLPYASFPHGIIPTLKDQNNCFWIFKSVFSHSARCLTYKSLPGTPLTSRSALTTVAIFHAVDCSTRRLSERVSSSHPLFLPFPSTQTHLCPFPDFKISSATWYA